MRKVQAPGLEMAAFVITAICLFSTDHPIGALVCIAFTCLIADTEVKKEKKKKLQEREVTEAADEFVVRKENLEIMTPFERDVALNSFRAGAKWHREGKPYGQSK